jgi:nitrite reductase/ring-hydroxylating ferredoxin subunit
MEVSVGRAEGFTDPGRRILDIDGFEVAVFQLDGQFYAWENLCPHQGGPACQGKMLPLALEAVGEDLKSSGRVFSKTEMNVVCPWHGAEFNIRTGRHPMGRWKLKPVAVRVDDGEVLIQMPARLAR